MSIFSWFLTALNLLCNTGLAVCRITGMRSITLWIISPTSSSGLSRNSAKRKYYSRLQVKYENDLMPFIFFILCPYSPQLRMSFIVFSTEGRILMPLTEDRWTTQRNSSLGFWFRFSFSGFFLCFLVFWSESRSERDWRSCVWCTQVETPSCTEAF